MFELMVNGQVFVSESYDAFCKDILTWEVVQRNSKKTSQDGKEGHDRHENNIIKLSNFLIEHQKNFKHR